MTVNFQMLGNAALMERPKIAFLSSRRVVPAAVMRCYDWATGMRGGGSAGRLALPCVVGGFQSALERDVLKLLLPDGGPPIVMVLARGMWRSVPMEYREAINAGRMLVVSPFSQGVVRVSKETAEKRNGQDARCPSVPPRWRLSQLVRAARWSAPTDSHGRARSPSAPHVPPIKQGARCLNGGIWL